MSYPIKISPEYLKVLKSVLKIYNDLPNKRHALFFKNGEHVYLSAMSLNTLVTVKTTSKHIQFDDEEIGITNLNQFLQYAEAIEYPSDENASIVNIIEKSTKNKDIYSFLFNGRRGSYRMPIAHPSEFDKKGDRKIPNEQSKDPLTLVAKFSLNEDDTKRLVKDITLMNKVKNFIFAIENNEICVYIKGDEQQQFTKKFDSMNSMVYNDYSTTGLKLFPTKIIEYMAYIGCDFSVDARTTPDNTLMALKCWGVAHEATSDEDSSINVFVGTSENSADVTSGHIDIIEEKTLVSTQ